MLGGIGIRFYAGAPIVNDAGAALGALCVVDRQPRQDVDPSDVLMLARLARAVALMLDQRRDVRVRNAIDGFARSSGLALVTADAAGLISFWNLAAQAMFGHKAREVVGRPVEVIMPERFRRDHARGLERLRAGGLPGLTDRAVEVIGLHRDGHEFTMEVSLCTWEGPQGPEFGAQIQDISARRARDLRLHHLARYDPLTGLPNRREFCERLKASWPSRAGRPCSSSTSTGSR